MNFWDKNTLEVRTKLYEDFMLPIFSDLLNLCDLNDQLESKIKRLTIESYNPYRHSSVNMDTRYDTSQLNRFESMGLAYIRIKLKERAANSFTEEILTEFILKHNLEIRWGVENEVVINRVGQNEQIDSTLIYICVSFDILRDYKLNKILEK